jgi:hypothetical protein
MARCRLAVGAEVLVLGLDVMGRVEALRQDGRYVVVVTSTYDTPGRRLVRDRAGLELA